MIFGASSANRSRTRGLHSALSRAVESRRETAQSITSIASPRRYGRDPGDVRPCRSRDEGSASCRRTGPITRRRGTKVKVGRALATGRGTAPYRERGRSKSGSASDPGAAPLRSRPAGTPSIAASQANARALRHQARREDDPVSEDRREQQLDVFGDDIPAALEERPRHARPVRGRGCPVPELPITTGLLARGSAPPSSTSQRWSTSST